MRLSGHTQPFAVLGHPIGHSLSPVMHNAAFEALGMDAIYLAFDVHPDRLMAALPGMADLGFRGVNLTVPLKEVAFRGLDRLDDSARMLGAVNTVEFLSDGLKGHNTDGKGFLLSLGEAFGARVSGLSVFVLGCGGAGRAVAITCAAERCGKIVVTDQDATRGEKAVGEIRAACPGIAAEAVPATREAWRGAARAADLVVQATPVGMKEGDASLLAPDDFRAGQLAFDLVYMYPETPFMAAARRAGARAANGLGMLLHQGAWAFRVWTGQDPAVEAMRAALEREVYGKD
jgi:shikimate dehydrogenase